MATGHWEEEMKVTAKDLRNGLAAAVQGIQWNYAIFWSASASQQGYQEIISSPVFSSINLPRQMWVLAGITALIRIFRTN